MTNVFLSHKKDFAAQAQALAQALSKIMPGVAIFRSEDIEGGCDWRDAVSRALEEAKCFILLYTDPTLDWSWCFYEAGAFVSNGRKPRPVFCLHPKTVEPPSPLANLQGIQAEQGDIEKWIRNGLCDVLKCRPKQTEDKLKTIAKDIAKLVNATAPLQEAILKPYILIEPKWSGDWTETDKIPEIDFANASVLIDRDSARELGFSGLPNLPLLAFLRRIACNSNEVPGKVEFWIKKFFESLQNAAEERLNFQEAAYFRHENGKIYRPVVVSYTKNASGTRCQLRVIFATAFGTPLTDSPGLTQRLSIGARLAVRTRLEVLDPFLGHTSQIYRDKVLSTRPENEVSRKNPIGGRLVEALDAIWQEALSHGMRPGEPAPTLFEGSAQQVYEDLRTRGIQVWEQIKEVAPREDRKATGNYPETEQLLAELNQINEDYLALVLPRIEELLVPVGKRHVKTIAVSPSNHTVRQHEAGFGDHPHHGIH
jgi:hypothetical protein